MEAAGENGPPPGVQAGPPLQGLDRRTPQGPGQPAGLLHLVEEGVGPAALQKAQDDLTAGAQAGGVARQAPQHPGVQGHQVGPHPFAPPVLYAGPYHHAEIVADMHRPADLDQVGTLAGRRPAGGRNGQSAAHRRLAGAVQAGYAQHLLGELQGVHQLGLGIGRQLLPAHPAGVVVLQHLADLGATGDLQGQVAAPAQPLVDQGGPALGHGEQVVLLGRLQAAV